MIMNNIRDATLSLDIPNHVCHSGLAEHQRLPICVDVDMEYGSTAQPLEFQMSALNTQRGAA